MPTTSKRKALQIAAIIGGVVALIGIAYAVWAIFLSPPNKQDFAEAKAKTEQIKKYSGTTLLREYNLKVIANSSEGFSQQKLVESVSSEKQKTLDALDSREKLAEEVGDSRVLRDDETKKAYDTYAAREERYSKYIQDYLEAYPLYVSSFDTCVDVFEITKKTTDDKELAKLHLEASKDCKQDLDSLAKSPITPFADYAKEFKRIVTERQKVFDGIKDGSLPVEEASAKIKQLGADSSENNPTDGVNKYGDAALFNGELNKLVDVLKKKSESQS